MDREPPLRLTDIEMRGDCAHDDPELKKQVSRILGVSHTDILELKVLRRSLDRRCRPPCTRFNVAVSLVDPAMEDKALSQIHPHHKARRLNNSELSPPRPRTPSGHSLVVGAGPAGLAAAWALLLEGRQVTLIERGEPVEDRLATVGHLWARGHFSAESNACFGEGGAGAFSDGKLVTRTRSPWRSFIMQTLVDFGASSEILVESQAHVGSDRLRRVVKAWREEMIQRGLNLRFSTRVDDLVVHNQKVNGVVTAEGETLSADRVIWACGGHARDSLEILQRHRVRITPRSQAVGFRIEHPQELINETLAGYRKGPACEYRLKTRVGRRGMYSFCMCPGGVVVAATSREGHQVVNGMSCHGKKSPRANSALVIEVGPEHYPEGPLGGLDFQSRLERQAFEKAGGGYQAPAQRLIDFMADKVSSSLPKTTYRPGVVASNLRELLDREHLEPYLEALPDFGRKLRGFISEEALLIGMETRTSCPITIERDEDGKSTLENLYCVGEGAGHAGGIMTSAYDACNILHLLARLEA